MTTFAVISAAMIAAALLWLAWPLFRKRSPGELAPHRREIRVSAIALAVLTPALAAIMYANLSDWDFDEADRQAARATEADRLLDQLKAKLEENPQDLDGWMLLGRFQVQMQRFPEAVEAFQHAYDISKGQNVDAMIGLAEALVLVDGGALTGRASELLDAALSKAPNHPKALFYGSMAAMQAGDLRKGRDRLQLLLAQNPPQELRGVIERQIQDLNAQIGETGEGAAPARIAASGRSIRVNVSISPEIKQRLSGSLALFVLARDPAGGPPLAVQRHSSDATPLTVELSERDAMMPNRTIANAPRVEIVARLSRSGAPQEQSGDFFGQAEYAFTGETAGAVDIIIDKVVP